MRDDNSQWDVCLECLDPLADGLSAEVETFHACQNGADFDRLYIEYWAFVANTSNCRDHALEAERSRRFDELTHLTQGQYPHSTAHNLQLLYRDCKVENAIDWLEDNESSEASRRFERTLRRLVEEFFDFSFKANEALSNHCWGNSGLLPNESHLLVRFFSRKTLLPDSGPDVDRKTIPISDGLRVALIGIVQEHRALETRLAKAVEYVTQLSQMLRLKRGRKESDIAQSRLTVSEASVLQKALDPCFDPYAAVAELRQKLDKARRYWIDEGKRLATSENSTTIKVMGFFTGGVSDKRLNEIVELIKSKGLSANDTLERINQLIPIRSDATAEELGKLVGVSKQAVSKTEFWQRRIRERAGDNDK